MVAVVIMCKHPPGLYIPGCHVGSQHQKPRVWHISGENLRSALTVCKNTPCLRCSVFIPSCTQARGFFSLLAKQG